MKTTNRIVAILFVATIAIIAVVSLLGILLPHKEPLTIQGTVEAPEVRIAGKLTGRVSQVYVGEGETVSVGDTLIAIHAPEVVAERAGAQAVAEATKAQSRKVEQGTRGEIVASAKEAWQGAKAQLSLAQKTYERLLRLWADSVVSLQRAEEAEALYLSAKAAESVAREQYRLARKGAQSEDKESAEQMALSAEAVVDAVDALLEDEHLLSPTAGIVTDIYPEVGELVTSGTPLLSITNLSAPYLVLNIREDLMPHFSLGGRFVGRVPALGGESVEWEIFYIAPLGNFATWRATNVAGGYDMRTFEIHARPTHLVDGLLAGMSVLTTLNNIEAQ